MKVDKLRYWRHDHVGVAPQRIIKTVFTMPSWPIMLFRLLCLQIEAYSFLWPHHKHIKTEEAIQGCQCSIYTSTLKLKCRKRDLCVKKTNKKTSETVHEFYTSVRVCVNCCAVDEPCSRKILHVNNGTPWSLHYSRDQLETAARQHADRPTDPSRQNVSSSISTRS